MVSIAPRMMKVLVPPLVGHSGVIVAVTLAFPWQPCRHPVDPWPLTPRLVPLGRRRDKSDIPSPNTVVLSYWKLLLLLLLLSSSLDLAQKRKRLVVPPSCRLVVLVAVDAAAAGAVVWPSASSSLDIVAHRVS